MDAVRFSRRALLFGRAAGTAADRAAVLPPWADAARFTEACDGCNACVQRCPPRVLVLRHGRAEFDPMLGECDYCGACVDACVSGALHRDQPADQYSARVHEGCLSGQGVVCASCREVCPTRAIAVPPGGRGAASIDAEACTGCGACVSICPTQAIHLATREAVTA